MKYSECNERQKKAFRNIYNAANWLVGGLENTLLDYRPDEDEYKAAAAELADHDRLVAELYEAAIAEVYTGDGVFFGKGAESFLRDVRFCGKEWLMERCEARIKKLGY